MKIIRETYFAMGTISHINIINDTTLKKLAAKNADAVFASDKKSFTIFRGGQRIVYRKK